LIKLVKTELIKNGTKFIVPCQFFIVSVYLI
jgi:hypothetical protein